jgi:hypothetical protein
MSRKEDALRETRFNSLRVGSNSGIYLHIAEHYNWAPELELSSRQQLTEIN